MLLTCFCDSKRSIYNCFHFDWVHWKHVQCGDVIVKKQSPADYHRKKKTRRLGSCLIPLRHHNFLTISFPIFITGLSNKMSKMSASARNRHWFTRRRWDWLHEFTSYVIMAYRPPSCFRDNLMQFYLGQILYFVLFCSACRIPEGFTHHFVLFEISKTYF